ncbi:hypothetical protein [uncultured Rhodoblastus sp.]|uniref:hypothetical protein n=1 Tax=uncultured Rhodoblastus sp. TaxID=543037 RepID=UPI0025DBAFC3|nr:hypothetical protein [uncultured Rhodoblastus sp.]
MSATILHLDPEVAAKFRNAMAMRDESRSRLSDDPQAARDVAKASARKIEEALRLAREKAPGRDA